jgi:UDP-N-acetylglucosamine 2-epimerase (non-hydrolysing)
MNIALIAGTRPEVIKMLPVYLELKRRGVAAKLILTGQHRELVSDVLRMVGVTPDVNMDVMQEGQRLSILTSKLASTLAHYITDTPPDIILVQGDTTSAMMGGLLGFYSGIPVGHIEAGLRTGNLQSPFPEEFNRRVITLATCWHFAPTTAAAANLMREGIAGESIYTVGNTAIDAALMISKQPSPAISELGERFPFLNSPEKSLVLITAHRRENFGEGIRSIAHAVRDLATARPDLHFMIPAHPNPAVRPVLIEMLSGITNVHITNPMGYDAMLFLMQKSLIILTDSGGIQEEAPIFNVPLLVLRNDTERPEGIDAGCSRLVGTDETRIKENFFHLMNNKAAYQAMAESKNPYGDGTAAAKIADILLSP